MFTIRESHLFKQQCANLGTAQRMDEALRAVTWKLYHNPYVWSIVEGYSNLRLAKTDEVGSGDNTDAQAFLIWYTIEDDSIVELQGIAVRDYEYA